MIFDHLSADASSRVVRDDPSLVTLISTEVMRLRRGFIGWYTVLAPIVIALPLYLGAALSPEGRNGLTWKTFTNVTLEFWGVLVPMTAALLAALSVRADQDSWRLMLSYAVPRWRYAVGKTAALAAFGLVSSLVLFAALLLGAAINGQLGDHLGMLAAASFLPWLAGLATTALAVAVAMAWGLGPTIALGVAGMLSGALISDKTFWYVVPFAWPMRVILPIAGIGPNGIPLTNRSPLTDRGVIPVAVGLSVSLAIVIAVAASLHMTKKEV